MSAADERRRRSLEAEIHERFGLVPAFFRLAESQATLERIWQQTRAGYLDNPIPWRFKEELFTYLSRFCDVPYCLARHAAILMGGEIAQTPEARKGPAYSADDVLSLIRRPIPGRGDMDGHLKLLASIEQPIEVWPEDVNSDLGGALFACAVQIFLTRTTSSIYLGELRRALGGEKLESLVSLLGFVRFAHDWTRAHPEIAFESDLVELLAAHPALRDWIENDHALVAFEARSDVLLELERLTGEHRALQLAMESLGSVLDESSNEIMLLDADTLRIIQVNRRACDHLGYSAEELCEKTLPELMQDVARDDFDERVAALRSRERARVEISASHQRKDGTCYPIEVHLQSILYEGRRALVAMIVDLSEQRAQEQRLEESQARARTILNTAPDAILTINHRGIIEGLNAAALRIFGYSESELLGQNVSILMPREEAQAHDGYLKRYLKTGEARIIGAGRELEGRRKDGRLFPLRLSVGETRFDGQRLFTGIVHDLTKENRIEAELDESTRRLRALFNQRLSLSILCSLDGRLLDANRAALDYVGAAREDVVGRPLWETPWWTHDARLQGELEQCLGRAASGEIVRFDATHRRGDGRLGVVDCSITPVRDADGELDVLLVECVDITEKHELQSQLLQSQKMEAIGMLAGGIAHDFNNLLTSIRGSDEILLDHLEPEGRMARSARRIMLAVDRATELTSRLLGLSRRKVTQRGPLDVNHTLAEIRDLFLRTLPEDVLLKTDLSSEPLQVKADEGQLGQVLMNLVVNARDAMPTGGSLVLSTGRRQIDAARASALGVEAGAFVAIGVRDFGDGIAPELLERIFEPFFTTKEPGRGTGLGLAMSHLIVREHGGAIEIDSTPGVGTTFTVLLPEIEGTQPRSESTGAQPAAAGAARRGARRSRPEKILVVEDDAVMRELVIEVLDDAGYCVTTAASPQEALAAGLDDGSELDLLLSDVVMPGMTGFDLSGQLRARHDQLRVLYMSGYSDQALADRGELTMEEPFIRKPFGNQELLTKVRAVLDSPAPDPPAPASA